MSVRPSPDQDIVVIGATGDLSRRKLLPALYNLSVSGFLPRAGNIVGAAPFDWSDEKFTEFARDGIKEFSRTGLDDKAFNAFAKRLHFVPLDDSGKLDALRSHLKQTRRLLYLAVPPSVFQPLIAQIGAADLSEGTSIIIEKPFGHDLESARALNRELHAVVPEKRVYRIDHYLGKETVQNLLVFRFGNSLFERVWNRDAIARVEITVAESIGVDSRGKLYEEIGALRDIVQNHMFQVLAVMAMEPPVSFEAEAIRNEKVKVLSSIHPLEPNAVVRAQYTAGVVDGKRVPGYRDEPGVAADSTTETFAAMRLQLDSWRWSGVPFLLRTGKRLPTRDTRIVVVFHDVPLHLFRQLRVHALDQDRLVVRIQPDEGIALTFVAKQPGLEVVPQPVEMNFSYDSSFRVSPPEAYERLLQDAMEGDHTLFIREDEVEHGWAAVHRVLRKPAPIHFYSAGSWGPAEAARIAAPGHWHDPEDDV